MTTFTEAQLERRCKVLGRSRESVAPCVLSSDGGRWTLDDTHEAYPHLRGLGDRVASTLAAVGVVSGDCACTERQAWLNEAGKRIGIG